MKHIVFALGILLPVVSLFAQKPDPWSKVEELKGGTELRVYKTGSPQPLLATFADLNGDNLIVVIKNTETAIPKTGIDRVDARPKGGTHMRTETTQSENPPDPGASNARDQIRPSSSSSANLAIGSKGDFVTVYRRTASAPPTAKPATEQ